MILRAAGNFFFRHRNSVFPLVLLGLLAASRPQPFWGSWQVDRIVDAAGIALVVAGHFIRALVIGLAYIRRGGKGGKVYADDLVVEGVFAYSRNPLYLGNLLMLAGIFLIANSHALTWIGIPFFAFAYGSIIFVEEEYLARKFGQRYDEYRRAVPRFFPRSASVFRVARGMTFDWRRFLRKDYGTIFTSATIVLIILLDETWTRWGRKGVMASALEYAALWAPVLILYAAVRFLKKTGRLRASDTQASG